MVAAEANRVFKRAQSAPRQNAFAFERGDNVAEIAAGTTKENRSAIRAVLDAERGVGVAVLVHGAGAVAAIVA